MASSFKEIYNVFLSSPASYRGVLMDVRTLFMVEAEKKPRLDKDDGGLG